MANYRVGDVIRLTRNAAGMTQEQLSEGICSVETFSRIENGKHKVKQSTYAQLMEKWNAIREEVTQSVRVRTWNFWKNGSG